MNEGLVCAIRFLHHLDIIYIADDQEKFEGNVCEIWRGGQARTRKSNQGMFILWQHICINLLLIAPHLQNVRVWTRRNLEFQRPAIEFDWKNFK